MVAKLKSLHCQGFKILIFTNQGNIGTELKGKRAIEVRAYIDAFVAELGIPVLVLMATQRDHYRKPRVGMWEYLEQNANGDALIDRTKSFYVGDASGGPGEHSADDSDFAEAAAVKFFHAHDYFGPPDPAGGNMVEIDKGKGEPGESVLCKKRGDRACGTSSDKVKKA